MEILKELSPFVLRHFRLETLVLESAALKNNPLRDSALRRNPVLIPREEKSKPWPVVFVLSGFTGNGPNSFGVRSFELNLPQVLDQCAENQKAPEAIFVFVDATTFWGGSQFINSEGTGLYEDYIIKELVPAVRASYPVREETGWWCVCGGSSGGYGALHLASRHPEVFGLVAAVAPDSFFEASLLPEIYAALPAIEKRGGVLGVRREMQEKEFYLRKEAHTVLNAIGMGTCYAPHAFKKGEVEWPVDVATGELIPEVWVKWKAFDPVTFLPEREMNLIKLKRLFLEVGERDQYHLHYGLRQIKRHLTAAKIPHDYSEFDGTHFDLASRRPEIWRWLKRLWG